MKESFPGDLFQPGNLWWGEVFAWTWLCWVCQGPDQVSQVLQNPMVLNTIIWVFPINSMTSNFPIKYCYTQKLIAIGHLSRRDDENHCVRRALGSLGVLRSDLVPLLRSCSHVHHQISWREKASYSNSNTWQWVISIIQGTTATTGSCSMSHWGSWSIWRTLNCCCLRLVWFKTDFCQYRILCFLCLNGIVSSLCIDCLVDELNPATALPFFRKSYRRTRRQGISTCKFNPRGRDSFWDFLNFLTCKFLPI